MARNALGFTNKTAQLLGSSLKNHELSVVDDAIEAKKAQEVQQNRVSTSPQHPLCRFIRKLRLLRTMGQLGEKLHKPELLQVFKTAQKK